MSEHSEPHTPTPEHPMRRDNTSPLQNPSMNRKLSKANRPKSPPVLEAETMTPPPSTQLPKASSKASHAATINRREQALASPPRTLRAPPPVTSGGLFGEIPSFQDVQEMNEGQLRNLVAELLPAFGEARVNAAHSKLQHSLLSIETEEAAKRAAVEHEATRREVQVLQEGSPVLRNAFSPRSSQATMQRNLQLALAHCRDLQRDNAILEKRLRSSKKVITQLDEQNSDLKENVHLLRQRIKDNRDHLNEMQSTGALSLNSTPAMDYSTPLHSRTPKTPINVTRHSHSFNPPTASQDAFDALLLAGQVMNGEANSVPSSPSQSRMKKLHSHHIRGAHSLSSLPTTPQRSRPVTADEALSHPTIRTSPAMTSSVIGTQRSFDEKPLAREDRESTISASEDEQEPYGSEDIPGSQASQAATDMLRRSLGPQSGNNKTPSHVPESSRLMQAKLFGQATKPGIGGVLKRGMDENPTEDSSRSPKKTRLPNLRPEEVGLGIKA
ncbi:hypothetical protein ACLMJK_004564 [Lecanora helva]